MSTNIVTQDRLKEILDYSPVTGDFTYKMTRGHLPKGAKAGFDVACRNGYVARRIIIDNKTYVAARLAWLYIYGEWPEGQIDHIDGNPEFNSILNLRDVSNSENCKNTKLKKRNLSGVNGIYSHNQYDKWVVHIQVAGKRTYLGVYEDFFEACCARKSAEYKNGYHINHGR